MHHPTDSDRQKWMVEEANRLIEARAKVKRPAQPVWTNQIHPLTEIAPDLERVAINDAAAQLTARMMEKDRANDNARW